MQPEDPNSPAPGFCSIALLIAVAPTGSACRGAAGRSVNNALGCVAAAIGDGFVGPSAGERSGDSGYVLDAPKARL